MQELNFKNEIDEVKINDTVLKLTNDPPPEIIADFFALQDIKPKDMTREQFLSPFITLKKYFYICNDKEKVNKFFKNIGINGSTKILEFVTNYLNESNNQKTKKKDTNG